MKMLTRDDVVDPGVLAFVGRHVADEVALALFKSVVMQRVGTIRLSHPDLIFNWRLSPALHYDLSQARYVPVYHLEYAFSNGTQLSFMLYLDNAGKITCTYELDPWVACEIHHV